ncbi:hypothetical protein EYZ11_012330 [Aspergillus tanneri]|uniref:Uncharacterized protein n=1 Tax=Aspergillus tanneri TaxID=1220188 RepID=A0A4S3J0J5_9EURO|nr:hypothetical protein EYZ11_012330 [Aspergillus tanneri]
MPLHLFPLEITLLYNFLISELYQRNIKSDGGSALVWYAIHGDEHGVRHMLAAGADVNLRSPNETQSTALLEAVIHKHTRVVELLLENGALPDAADLRARRPLVLATAERSDVTITELLLSYGARVNSVVFDKRAPLMEAIRSNQESKVVLLLKRGADTHILGSGNTLLHVAATKNASPTIMKMLIDSGIQVDSQDSWGRTPLQVAAYYSCARAVRLLLHYGADPNFKNTRYSGKGRTALFYAAEKPRNSRKDNKAIIRTLVMQGAQVDAIDDRQETPLLYAVSQGAIKQAQALVENGSSIMARDAGGETVLHLATRPHSGCPGMMGWLVECGADVNWAGGKQSETPIFNAIRYSYCRQGVKSAHNLLSLGADVHFRNIDGLTPLSLAARMCSIELTTMLLERGASVNSRDMQGKSPLHHVAEYCFRSEARKVIALLLEHGADVNSQDHSGFTALHTLVAKGGSWEAAGDMLKAGADRYAMSNDGRFPHDMVPAGPWAETKRLFIRSYTS